MKKLTVTERKSASDKMFETFSQMLIEQIETICNSNYEQPWVQTKTGIPQNLKGREYNATNALFLWFHTQKEGYKYPIYLTIPSLKDYNLKATKETFIHVLKNSKSFPVFFYEPKAKDFQGNSITIKEYNNLEEKAKANYKKYCIIRVYFVFNIAQTNMETARPDLYKKITQPFCTQLSTNKTNMFEPLNKMIKNQTWICPINEKEQDHAFYNIKDNEITLPLREQFKYSEGFVTTAFHEMAHSTGHKNYLDRLDDKSQEGYAKEELIAELSAAITCAQYGIDAKIDKNSIPYIKWWLAQLKKSPAFLKSILNDVKKVNNILKEHIDLESEINENAA